MTFNVFRCFQRSLETDTSEARRCLSSKRQDSTLMAVVDHCHIICSHLWRGPRSLIRSARAPNIHTPPARKTSAGPAWTDQPLLFTHTHHPHACLLCLFPPRPTYTARESLPGVLWAQTGPHSWQPLPTWWPVRAAPPPPRRRGGAGAAAAASAGGAGGRLAACRGGCSVPAGCCCSCWRCRRRRALLPARVLGRRLTAFPPWRW